MISPRELGKSLAVPGAAVCLIGVFLWFGGRIPLRLGRLPGDIVRAGEHGTLYFPITTCILLSLILSLLFWLAGRIRR